MEKKIDNNQAPAELTFDITDERIFHHAVSFGFKGTLDQYNEDTKALPQTTEEETIDKLHRYLNEGGYTEDKEYFARFIAQLDASSTQLGGKEWRTFEVKKRRSNYRMGHGGKAVIALLPAMIFLILFTFYPIINTFIISFIEDFSWARGSGSFAILNYFRRLTEISNWQTGTPPPTPNWGFANYAYAFQDPSFTGAIGNTFILTIIIVPLSVIISLLIAVFLNSIKTLRGFYQTVFFLPYVTNTIAIGMVFSIMFSHESGGMLNQFLGLFGVEPQHWVTMSASKFNSGVAIVVYNVWNSMAFKILVFMSGLQSIDKQYYDASRIDGANRFTIFRRITVPLLSPQILYILITSTIGSFKMYTSVISLFGRSADGAGSFGGSDGLQWLTVVGYIYKNRDSRLAIASAGSVVLLLIVLVITLIQMQVSKRRVYY